jgi:hypothetical protein
MGDHQFVMFVHCGQLLHGQPDIFPLVFGIQFLAAP